MPDGRRVILIAGGLVGAAFFEVLLAAHHEGLCVFSALVAAGRSRKQNQQLKERAEEAGISVFGSPECVLDIKDPWLGFSVGNSLILKTPVLDAPVNGIINFHAAPLPRFKGSAAPAFAIAEGIREFGVTFHKMIPALDAGAIVLSKAFLIEDEDTASEIDDRCIELGTACFRDNLADFVALNFTETTNDSDRPAYRRREMEAYRKLDLSWPKEKIWRHVRACDWDGVLQPAYFEIGGRTVFVTASVRGTWI